MKIKPALFALMIGGFAFIMLISFVYAFVQQAEAKLQAKLVMECSQETQKLNQMLSDRTQSLQLALDQVAQKNSLLEEQAAKSKNKK